MGNELSSVEKIDLDKEIKIKLEIYSLFYDKNNRELTGDLSYVIKYNLKKFKGYLIEKVKNCLLYKKNLQLKKYDININPLKIFVEFVKDSEGYEFLCIVFTIKVNKFDKDVVEEGSWYSYFFTEDKRELIDVEVINQCLRFAIYSASFGNYLELEKNIFFKFDETKIKNLLVQQI